MLPKSSETQQNPETQKPTKRSSLGGIMKSQSSPTHPPSIHQSSHPALCYYALPPIPFHPLVLGNQPASNPYAQVRKHRNQIVRHGQSARKIVRRKEISRNARTQAVSVAERRNAQPHPCWGERREVSCINKERTPLTSCIVRAQVPDNPSERPYHH